MNPAKLGNQWPARNHHRHMTPLDSQDPPGVDSPFSIGLIWLALTNREQATPVNPMPLVVMGTTYDSPTAASNRIATLVQLTYRYGFQPIPKDPTGPSPLNFLGSALIKGVFTLPDLELFTSDVGWGCMIRTSQTLLANALLRSGQTFEQVVGQFLDTPEAPYSLHNFVKVAGELPLQVKPGQWFGPNAASLSILKLLSDDLHVIIGESGDVPSTILEFPTLLLMPVRLGIDSINKYYHESLFHLLSLPQLVGIAGGKPSASYYFFGYEDQDLLYFDPHSPQSIISTSGQDAYATYRPSGYQRSHLSTLDPSMMIGVYFGSQADFDDFKSQCGASKNRIVHFSLQKSSAQNSEFIHVRQDVDEFVDLGGEPGEDDFVDLGSSEPPAPADDAVLVDKEDPSKSIDTLEEYEPINLLDKPETQ